jgi:gamma-glutamylcyclotransferase (GGCT)/AIG2-like uncharacterized protein YtfP
MKQVLFVYGTLAEHPPREIADVVQRLELIGDGFIFGRLYDLGEYPGAVLGSCHDKIFGKVLRLPEDDAETLLCRLDAYEGYDPKDPASSLFIRRRTTISRPNHSPVIGWVYEYRGSVKSRPLIKGGHYSRVPA